MACQKSMTLGLMLAKASTDGDEQGAPPPHTAPIVSCPPPQLLVGTKHPSTRVYAADTQTGARRRAGFHGRRRERSHQVAAQLVRRGANAWTDGAAHDPAICRYDQRAAVGHGQRSNLDRAFREAAPCGFPTAAPAELPGCSTAAVQRRPEAVPTAILPTAITVRGRAWHPSPSQVDSSCPRRFQACSEAKKPTGFSVCAPWGRPDTASRGVSRSPAARFLRASRARHRG